MALFDDDLLEAAARIAALSDDTLLTTDEAAVFLRCSKRTLERLRGEGGGPAYSQGGVPGARGRNQGVVYRLRALKDWIEGNAVRNTIEAAVRKGHAFTTLQEAMMPAPFWKNERGYLGRVFDSSADEFFQRLGQLEIVWVSPVEAAQAVWADPVAHESIATTIQEILRCTSQGLSSAVEQSAILSEV